MRIQSKSPEESPFELSMPTSDLGDYSHLWYGLEKIGKTSLAAQFPDPVFLMCEPGGKALKMNRRNVMDWADFKRCVDWLEAHPKKFQTVIVDTADRAAKMCEDAVLRKLAIQHASDEEWGKGWAMIGDEFARVISKLLKLNRGVIFTSHAEEREIKARDGKKYDRVMPTMPKMARKVLEPIVDIWMYLEYGKGQGREMVVRGNSEIAAGHRLQHHFLGVDRIPMGSNAEEAYSNFVRAFNNELDGAEARPAKASGSKLTLRR